MQHKTRNNKQIFRLLAGFAVLAGSAVLRHSLLQYVIVLIISMIYSSIV